MLLLVLTYRLHSCSHDDDPWLRSWPRLILTVSPPQICDYSRDPSLTIVKLLAENPQKKKKKRRRILRNVDSLFMFVLSAFAKCFFFSVDTTNTPYLNFMKICTIKFQFYAGSAENFNSCIAILFWWNFNCTSSGTMEKLSLSVDCDKLIKMPHGLWLALKLKQNK